jgi:hypothetical protein
MAKNVKIGPLKAHISRTHGGSRLWFVVLALLDHKLQEYMPLVGKIKNIFFCPSQCMGSICFRLISNSPLVAVDFHCEPAHIRVKSYKMVYYTPGMVQPLGRPKIPDSRIII